MRWYHYFIGRRQRAPEPASLPDEPIHLPPALGADPDKTYEDLTAIRDEPGIIPTRPPPPPPPGRVPDEPAAPDEADVPEERKPTVPPPHSPSQRKRDPREQRRTPPEGHAILIKDRVDSGRWHGGNGLASCAYLGVELVGR